MHDITKRVITYNSDRLEDIKAYKYRAMAENAFSFYRGACHIFYEDFAASGVSMASPKGWICGDLHLENFGSYKGETGLVYFDLNDFDESVLAPVHWEAVRLVTSIFIAFDSLGIEKEKAEKLAALYLKTYSATLSKGRPLYVERQTANGIIGEFLAQAKKRSDKKILDKKTVTEKSKKFISIHHKKHLELKPDRKQCLINALGRWLATDEKSPYNYSVLDAAFRLAGTGSLGTSRYVFLLKSSNDTGEKFLLVDMKEALPSALRRHEQCCVSEWASEAERIMSVQTIMQNCPPALLSFFDFEGKAYIVQQLQPEKDSINFKMLKDRYRDMLIVVDTMAMLTASSQLRSSGRRTSAPADELIEFGRRTDWHEEMISYSKQTAAGFIKYYNEFTADIKDII